MTTRIILFLLHIVFALSATLQVIAPPALAAQFPNPMILHLSPIGFRPLSGRLEGRAVVANPGGACDRIQDLHSQGEDIFVLADDSECLESVKGKNIANSGGYAGIIKQNINNTLHDKEAGLIHIPLLELSPMSYDLLISALKDSNSSAQLLLDFTDHTQTHPINLQLWLSPLDASAYEFILSLQDFINGQQDVVGFTPHYVLQSQRESKIYIGCLSSGRYCPTEIAFQGKYEGKNIVEETLRQLVVWKMGPEYWWHYAKLFLSNCLPTPDIFLNSTLLEYCSENAMVMSGVDITTFQRQYSASFLGSRKEVDDNTYLLQERQAYVNHQFPSHPTALINRKPLEINTKVATDKICRMQADSPSAPCKAAHGLTTSQILILVGVMGASFIGIAALYRLYMHMRMRKQIKSEVDRTLEQYYRYIETMEGQDGQLGKSKGKKEKKQKSRVLTEELEEVEAGETQMRDMK